MPLRGSGDTEPDMTEREFKQVGAHGAVGLQPLLHAFEALRAAWPQAWPGLPRVLDGALNWLCEGAPRPHDPRAERLLTQVRAAAAIVEHEGALQADRGCEPSYHNRLHLADTVVSMATLLKARREWAPRAVQSLQHAELLCLLAMVIHDFQHQGQINESPGEIERHSLQHFMPHARTLGLTRQDWTTLTRLVLNTDPASVGPLHDEFRAGMPVPQAPLELREMAVLVTEADVLASGLPRIGHALGEALTREWGPRYPDRAARLATPEGRLGFLAFGARFSSPAALRLGIPAVLQAQVTELSRQIQQRSRA